MKHIQCVIVDDNADSNAELKIYCERIPFLRLQKSFDNIFDAIEYLRDNSVDLLICSTELKEMNGIDFVSNLKPCPEVVFVSDSEQYAFVAYEFGAIDYMLRPVDFPRMLRAANKAWRLLKNPSATSEEQIVVVNNNLSEQLFIKSENRIVRISCENILLIEGYGDYIKIHTDNQGVILSPWGIKILESKLPEGNFVRVHRSYIVAIDKIEEIENKRIKIGQLRIPISETFAKKLYNKLGINKF